VENWAKILGYLSTALAWVVETVLSGVFWLGVCAGALFVVVVRLVLARTRYRTSQVSLNLPFGLGNITYEATDQDRVLAWKMYVQLKTRKAALPFDEDHDVIINVFDSLRDVFSVTRDLLSEASPHQGEAQRSVADFVLRVLNDGIRPHLTRWHASFAAWWDKAMKLPENDGKSPEDVQRGFPEYDALVADLKKMNDELAQYAGELLLVVHAGRKDGRRTKEAVEILPEQLDLQSPPLPTAVATSDPVCPQPETPESEESA